MTTPCRCCKEDIKIEYQPRPRIIVNGVVKREAKSDLLLITCRNADCLLDDVTLTVYTLEDYLTMDLTEKLTINK